MELPRQHLGLPAGRWWMRGVVASMALVVSYRPVAVGVAVPRKEVPGAKPSLGQQRHEDGALRRQGLLRCGTGPSTASSLQRDGPPGGNESTMRHWGTWRRHSPRQSN